MKRKNWTDEDEQVLLKMLDNGESCHREIGKILNRTEISVKRYAIRHGFSSKYRFKKYSVDNNFWLIPNYVNTYHAGFSAADAAIIQRSANQFIYVMHLARNDRSHLEMFARDCQYNGPIRDCVRKSNGLLSSSIEISSLQWAENLRKNFNIIPNKTTRLAPPEQLSDDLLYYYFKGLVSGDGNIHFNKINKLVTLGFSSASLNLMLWIKKFTDRIWTKSLLNTKCNVAKIKNKNCWQYTIGGVRAGAIVDFLRQLPVGSLSRKWDQPVVLDYIDKKKAQYPHLFYTYQPPIENISNPAPNSVNSLDSKELNLVE